MPRIVAEQPGFSEVKAVLDQYVGRPFTVQLNGLCTVNYQGRAKSSLDRGERIVLIKQDSALLVHGPEQYQPKNWQPRVDAWTVDVDGDVLRVQADRMNPRERVEIVFDDVSLLVVDQLVDTSELQVRGHEIDIHEAIENNPALVEDGLTVVEREKQTPAGFIDVFARDEKGDFVVVEVKRTPDHNTVLQLQRYVEEIEKEYAGRIRGVLMAPTISEKVLAYLEDRGLEFVEVDMADVITSYTPLDTQTGLDAFTA